VSALLLIAVVVLVLVNGFFVAAEFALVRARRSRVEALAEDGAGGAKLALVQLDRIDEYLSACQLGITMASLGIGFLGEPAIAQLLEEPLGGVLSHAVAVGIAVAISYLLVTAAHITIGEQVPKIYAITHAEGTVRVISRPLEWFRVATRPLIWLLNSASNGILRLIGTDPKAEFAEGSSSQELRQLIAESVTGGHLDREEADMLTGVFHLHEQQARQVMTPAPAVVTVDVDDTVETALHRCIESGHTRLVVTERHDDSRIVGVVHSNELARLLLNEKPDTSVRAAIRPPLFTPETRPLDDLLADLRRQRSSIAIVSDEYGQMVGIVTVEDLVEEIVGEIVDETTLCSDPYADFRTATGWYEARSRSPTSPTTASPSTPATTTHTGHSVASSSPTSIASQDAARPSTSTATPSRSTPSAPTGSKPSASSRKARTRPHRARHDKRPAHRQSGSVLFKPSVLFRKQLLTEGSAPRLVLEQVRGVAPPSPLSATMRRPRPSRRQAACSRRAPGRSPRARARARAVPTDTQFPRLPA
jgi:CBS domain containing-hemolysin-like protein